MHQITDQLRNPGESEGLPPVTVTLSSHAPGAAAMRSDSKVTPLDDCHLPPPVAAVLLVTAVVTARVTDRL